MRLKNQQVARIAAELTNPQGLAQRVLPKLVYGAASPYAKGIGSGDAKAVAQLTRDDLIAFQQAWLRPDKAKIFVVSDRPLAEVKATLDARFGDWTPTGAAGTKDFSAPATPAAPKILLIDRPDSPQSLIVGAATDCAGRNRRSAATARRQRFARRGFHCAPQHGFARSQALVLRRQRQLPPGAISDALCHRRTGAGRQDRRIDRGAARRSEGVPHHQRRDQGRIRQHDQRFDPLAPRQFRDVGRGARRDAAERSVSPSGRLLRVAAAKISRAQRHAT